eukprot:Tamp_18510.p4 GENE.Tamp_18510~~Tamp_18510.p4  ORF type:complete len:125 (-),score=13.59 Tamp_18510:452-826(-)
MRADCFIYMSDLATPGSHATKRPSPPPARRSSTPPLPGSDQEYFRRCIMGDYSNVDKNCCGISAKFKAAHRRSLRSLSPAAESAQGLNSSFAGSWKGSSGGSRKADSGAQGGTRPKMRRSSSQS